MLIDAKQRYRLAINLLGSLLDTDADPRMIQHYRDLATAYFLQIGVADA